MTVISAQVSLYPLRQMDLGPAIREAVRIFREHDLEAQVGPMSTVLWGADVAVFAALQAAFSMVAQWGDVVMVVTLSNACSKPKDVMDA